MQTSVSLLFTTPIFLFFFGPLDPVSWKRLLDKALGQGPAFFNRVQVRPCLLFRCPRARLESRVTTRRRQCEYFSAVRLPGILAGQLL